MFTQIHKSYFCRKQIEETLAINEEYFIISLLHGTMVLKKLDNTTRKQYCSIQKLQKLEPYANRALIEGKFAYFIVVILQEN